MVRVRGSSLWFKVLGFRVKDSSLGFRVLGVRVRGSCLGFRVLVLLEEVDLGMPFNSYDLYFGEWESE